MTLVLYPTEEIFSVYFFPASSEIVKWPSISAATEALVSTTSTVTAEILLPDLASEIFPSIFPFCANENNPVSSNVASKIMCRMPLL